jgi:hypothetical protein
VALCVVAWPAQEFAAESKKLQERAALAAEEMSRGYGKLKCVRWFERWFFGRAGWLLGWRVCGSALLTPTLCHCPAPRHIAPPNFCRAARQELQRLEGSVAKSERLASNVLQDLRSMRQNTRATELRSEVGCAERGRSSVWARRASLAGSATHYSVDCCWCALQVALKLSQLKQQRAAVHKEIKWIVKRDV